MEAVQKIHGAAGTPPINKLERTFKLFDIFHLRTWFIAQELNFR